MLVLKDVLLFLLLVFRIGLVFLNPSLNVILLNLADEAQAVAVVILNLKSVEECAAVLELRNEVNAAAEFFDDELGDHQS